ncbi:MAG: energy-coupled thiamine transporter ThiT [Actinomycetia bacterium]|nr:energy-coupled thiamine transporter ThiT [Actinomycetes bacterium]
MASRSSSKRTQRIAAAGLCVALFSVLQYVGIRLPINFMGGTISFSMLPIVLFSLVYGPGWGMVVGALCGCVDLIFEPYLLYPAQVLLDYPLAFACVGLAGLVAPLTWRRLARGRKAEVAVLAAAAALLGAGCRFVLHFISGVIFFASAAKGQNVYLYSAVYNLSYLIPAGVACGVVLALVAPVVLPLLRTQETSHD